MSLQNVPLAFSLVLMTTISVGLHLYKLSYIRKFFLGDTSHVHASTQVVAGDIACAGASKNLEKLSNERIIAWRDEYVRVTMRTMMNVIRRIQDELNKDSSCRICLLTGKAAASEKNPSKPPKSLRTCAPRIPKGRCKIRGSKRIVPKRKRNVQPTKEVSYIVFDEKKCPSLQILTDESVCSNVQVSHGQTVTSRRSGQTTDDISTVATVKSFETVVDLEGQAILKSIEEREKSFHLDGMTFYFCDPSTRDQLDKGNSLERDGQIEKAAKIPRAEGDRNNNDLMRSIDECLSGNFGFAFARTPQDLSKIPFSVNAWDCNPCEMKDFETMRKVYISEHSIFHFADFPEISRPVEPYAQPRLSNVGETPLESEEKIGDSQTDEGDLEFVSEETTSDWSTQSEANTDEDVASFDLSRTDVVEDTPSTSAATFLTAEDKDLGGKKKTKVKRIFGSLLKRSKTKIFFKKKK